MGLKMFSLLLWLQFWSPYIPNYGMLGYVYFIELGFIH